MNTEIFNEFIDKNVEVSTNNKTYSGSLKRDEAGGTLIVTPVDKYAARRYGPAIIDQNAVVSIRTILPREDRKSEDKQGYFQGGSSCDSNDNSESDSMESKG